MNTWSRKRYILEAAVRLIADALMVNAALMLALAWHYFQMVGMDGAATSAQVVFDNYHQTYLQTSWLLTLVCLAVFYLSGFYTRGRFYHGRYKALVVAQAVTLSYVSFGFIFAFLPMVNIAFPRSVLMLSWLLTLILLFGARLWSMLWKAMIRAESRPTAPRASGDIRKVLVIGGAGYIGSALVPKLLNKGYEVRVLDLLVFGSEPIASVIGHPRLEIMQGDFLQADKVVKAMRDVDAVVHLGAIVGDPACAVDGELTLEVNLVATRMISEIAKAGGVKRFIFASTCSVYGASDETLDEHSTLNPVSLYARSKIASERLLQQLADGSFSPVILRFATIYGLSGRTRFDLVVNVLAAKAVTESQITISGGDQWRPFVHVDDAALAALTALEAPRPVVYKETFNVGSNEQNYTIQQVGEIIRRLVPTAQVVNMGSDTDRRNYRVDFSKIRRMLGFAPQWTVEKGVLQVVEAIRSGKVRNYRDIKYSNVKCHRLFRLAQDVATAQRHENHGNGGWLDGDAASNFSRHKNAWIYDLISETSAHAPASGERGAERS
jgi:nucleoside-diphosphate-sugar epimerase